MGETGWTIEELRYALRESVKLQSHYADLLNMWDDGRRIVFKDENEWLERLRKLKSLRSRLKS